MNQFFNIKNISIIIGLSSLISFGIIHIFNKKNPIKETTHLEWMENNKNFYLDLNPINLSYLKESFTGIPKPLGQLKIQISLVCLSKNDYLVLKERQIEIKDYLLSSFQVAQPWKLAPLDVAFFQEIKHDLLKHFKSKFKINTLKDIYFSQFFIR